MMCPKCQGHRCKYKVSWARKPDGLRHTVTSEERKKGYTRTDFSAKCQDCDWVGEI